MKEFENQEIDHTPELPELSIPQISQAASRSGSPEFRFCTYQKNVETPTIPVIESPNPYFSTHVFRPSFERIKNTIESPYDQ